MAKEATATKEKAHKFMVKDLADAAGLTEFTVRNKLRALKVEKNGASYGWNTKTEFDAVVKQMKAEAKPAAEPKAKAAKAEKKPAAKSGKAKAAAPMKKKPKKSASSETTEAEATA